MPEFTTAREWAEAAHKHVQDLKGSCKLMFADDPGRQMYGLSCPHRYVSSEAMFRISLENFKRSTTYRFDPLSIMLKDYTKSQAAKKTLLDFLNTYHPLVIPSRFDRLLGEEL